MSIEKAIAAIEAQQAGLEEYSAARMVGEQLKDIVRSTPEAAELVEQDLQVEEMHIKKCEAEIEKFAKGHQSGNCGRVPPNKADEIIRKFYGIGKAKAEKSAAGINLLDFM